MWFFFHYTYHYSPEYLFSDLAGNNFAKYGWVGVDIFFIVSGYCIAMTIVRTNTFLDFIVKRFARLYPAYFVFGLTTLIFYYFFELPGREVGLFEGFMNLIFANFIPGLNFKYIDGIYWALIVEIKFYIFFGIIYFISRSLSTSIMIWLTFSVILTLIKVVDHSNNFIFLTSICPHLNLFLLGLSIYKFKDLKILFKIIIILYVVISIYFTDRFTENVVLFYLIFSLTSIILFKKFKINFKPLTLIGLISYSWYLSHNAIGIIIIRELNKLNYNTFSIITAFIFTLTLSFLVYYFIETNLKKIIIKLYNKNNKF